MSIAPVAPVPQKITDVVAAAVHRLVDDCAGLLAERGRLRRPVADASVWVLA